MADISWTARRNEGSVFTSRLDELLDYKVDRHWWNSETRSFSGQPESLLLEHNITVYNISLDISIFLDFLLCPLILLFTAWLNLVWCSRFWADRIFVHIKAGRWCHFFKLDTDVSQNVTILNLQHIKTYSVVVFTLLNLKQLNSNCLETNE